MLFIEQLLLEAMAYDGQIESPTLAVQENETVVGTASEEIQRLHCFLMERLHELEQTISAHEKMHDKNICISDTECYEILTMIRKFHEFHRILVACIREEFDLWTKDGAIQIRENWQVVLQPCQCESREDFERLFSDSLREALAEQIMPSERDPDEVGN